MALARRLIEPELLALKAALLILKMDIVANTQIYKKVMEKWQEEFEKDKPNLTEKIEDSNGKYIGETKDGMKQGKGILIKGNGEKYEGEWS